MPTTTRLSAKSLRESGNARSARFSITKICRMACRTFYTPEKFATVPAVPVNGCVAANIIEISAINVEEVVNEFGLRRGGRRPLLFWGLPKVRRTNAL
jgi:hypothetical protein